ncbi:Small RNA 2'-O-methyltransferase [Platanthera zijinensis]|uniref:Small RNA 2'-O-methyltransferase n=1 Tax=Platanthera zijinensis TaxID=2320716 RepID=A0AAP0B0R5_9ASPA
MEEDQACLFGDVALSFFRPAALVVSTPNYEYNPILRRSANPGKEDSEDRAASTKFRNHDHKFEWTRLQFQRWASDLAARHHYSVEFSGVGGSIDVEPGFASQIAVFKRGSDQSEKQFSRAEEPSQPYEVVWQWSDGSAPAAT